VKTITAPAIGSIVSLLLNLLAALMATSIAQSPFARFIHFAPPYRPAMLRADVLIVLVAFGMGFAVYRRWRPEVSKWLWLAGVCWYVPRTLLTLNVNQDSVLDDRGGATSPTFQDLAHWREFTVPCLRLAFYSAGAYCCSLWLNRTRAVWGLPVGSGGNERKLGRKLRIRQADGEIALGRDRGADERAGESRDEPTEGRRSL